MLATSKRRLMLALIFLVTQQHNSLEPTNYFLIKSPIVFLVANLFAVTHSRTVMNLDILDYFFLSLSFLQKHQVSPGYHFNLKIQLFKPYYISVFLLPQGEAPPKIREIPRLPRHYKRGCMKISSTLHFSLAMGVTPHPKI